ncbi:class I adenylate-forming enzyme family protein [Nonomuraea wenchangensis]|uniref:class I adenylate-forming enzyme family protein n=1 Tax=Nonomuraea wenchangensis TaxID=568860 RepID=UPI00384F2F6C
MTEIATVHGLLAFQARRHPDREALVATAGDGAPVRWSYRQLEERVDAVARFLVSATRPGDRIAIWAGNDAEWVEIEYAAARAGRVLVALNPALTADELRYALTHSGAVLLLHGARYRGVDMAGVASAISAECPRLQTVVSLSDRSWLFGADSVELPPPPVDPDAIFMIQYTSGTTGRPKGVLLSHRSALSAVTAYVRRLDLRDGTVCVNPMPMFHTGGCIIALLAIHLLGGRLVLLPRFGAHDVLVVSREEQADMTIAVPTMLHDLIAAVSEGAPAHQYRTISSGAAPTSPALIARAQTVFGAVVHAVYGQTEIGSAALATSRADSDKDHATTVGTPFEGIQCRIMDPVRGRECARGEIGELWLRGDQIMAGYLDDPGATEATIVEGGWLRTGDLGVMDERGYVRITGRLKELINRGGENISPLEIEECLRSEGKLVDAAVVGLPDDRLGEIVAAVVRADGPVSREELEEWCRTRLTRFKVPSRWFVIDDYPLTPSGKIRKHVLTEMLQAGSVREL